MSATATGYLASKPRYEILDGLRGVAAMIVVAMNSHSAVDRPTVTMIAEWIIATTAHRSTAITAPTTIVAPAPTIRGTAAIVSRFNTAATSTSSTTGAATA